MDDIRPKPTQGWSAAKETLKSRIRVALATFGVLSILGIVIALALPDPDTPSQSNYEQCLEQAAERAHGAVAIFNRLMSAKCDRLKPLPGSVSSLAAPSAAAFLDSPAKPVTDSALLKKLNSPAGQVLTFHGYTCTTDCSGHAAGYRWAQRNDIYDEDGCTGRSRSFIEGCLAYVEEHQ